MYKYVKHIYEYIDTDTSMYLSLHFKTVLNEKIMKLHATKKHLTCKYNVKYFVVYIYMYI